MDDEEAIWKESNRDDAISMAIEKASRFGKELHQSE